MPKEEERRQRGTRFHVGHISLASADVYLTPKRSKQCHDVTNINHTYDFGHELATANHEIHYDFKLLPFQPLPHLQLMSGSVDTKYGISLGVDDDHDCKHHQNL